jgi:hypothetical protein
MVRLEGTILVKNTPLRWNVKVQCPLEPRALWLRS